MDYTINPGSIALWLGSGLFAILISIAGFTMRDLYRRLRDLEEAQKKLIQIEIYTMQNKETLDKIVNCVENIARNCIAQKVEKSSQSIASPSCRQ